MERVLSYMSVIDAGRHADIPACALTLLHGIVRPTEICVQDLVVSLAGGSRYPVLGRARSFNWLAVGTSPGGGAGAEA